MAKSSSANFGIRLAIKQGETCPVQFLTKPDEFQEYSVHSWSDGGRWYFVPCAGEECPLCQDEDRKRAKASYRFAALVYNIKEKKVQILEGPKDLAGRIFYRFERKPTMFLKRTYDVTKFPTQPVTYDFSIGEDDLISLASIKSKAKGVDIDKYLEGELKSFYGEDLPEASALTSTESDVDEDEDDDEDEMEDVEYTMADLKKMKIAKLKEIAEDLEIDIEDMDKSDLIEAIVDASSDEDEESEEEDDEEEDEEDEDETDEEDEDEEEDDDDEDEEDEDDDEEPPAKRPARPAKKAAKKSSAVKKTASRRR